MAKSEPRGEAFYRQLVADWRRSRKSLRKFAASRGIPAGTLSYWANRLKKLDAARAKGRAGNSASAKQEASKEAPSEASTRSAFLPVRVVEPAPTREASAYELVLSKGVLRLPADFDPVRVGALMREAGIAC